MANESPAKSLVDIDLASLRVSSTAAAFQIRIQLILSPNNVIVVKAVVDIALQWIFFV